MSEPQAMTLEEALQVAKANAWDVMFEPGGFVGIARTDGKGGIAFAEGWDVAFSAALGYPVVERDPAAELVEAVEAWAKAYSRAYDEPLGPSEVDDAVWQFDRAEADLLAALARYRGEP